MNEVYITSFAIFFTIALMVLGELSIGLFYIVALLPLIYALQAIDQPLMYVMGLALSLVCILRAFFRKEGA